MAGQDPYFTHFDAAGQAHMVDVAAKDATRRIARAGGRIAMRAETLELIQSGSAQKGDVLGVARVAAIQAAKRAADLIPLAHPLPLTRVAVDFSIDDRANTIVLEATVETIARTGVERPRVAAGGRRAAQGGRRQLGALKCPDLPPDFSSRRMLSMRMPRSTALHMS